MTGPVTMRMVKSMPGQYNDKDCGVFCCVYMRNQLTGEDYRFEDDEPTSLVELRIVMKLLFLEKDVQKPRG